MTAVIAERDDAAALLESIEEELDGVDYLVDYQQRHVREHVTENRFIPWTPTPKQTVFLGLPVRECLFGGASGPGKTTALLMHAAKWVMYPQYRAIIFRRQYPDLTRPGAILDMANAWWSPTDAYYRGDTHSWYFPSGARIDFGYMAHDRHVWNYYGPAYHCVSKGTPVIMADGTLRPVEDVHVGEYVETLEGPRQVTASVDTGQKETVRIVTPDGTETIVAAAHRVLTPGGWVYPTGRQPRRFPSDDTLTESSTANTAAPSRHDGSTRRDRWRGIAHGLRTRRRIAHSADGASTSPDRGTDSESSAGPRRADGPLPPCWRMTLRLYGHRPDPAELVDPPRGASDVRHSTRTAEDSMDHYSPSPPYVRGGLLRALQVIGRRRPPSPDGAASRIPGRSRGDDLARIRAHSRGRRRMYVHPYTMERRVAYRPSVSASVEISPAGVRATWDLTIASSNHYVTMGGIIHQNSCCFDELTQFSRYQYRFLFSRQRKLVDDPIPLTMRSGSNPPMGGAADIGWWVKDDLYDRGFPSYIPSLAIENPAIDYDSYVESLSFLDPITREKLLRGDWSLRASGAAMRRDYFPPVESHEIPQTAWLGFARGWDLAASEPTPEKPNPDATVGALVGFNEDGYYYLLDVRRVQMTTPGVEAAITQCAKIDLARTWIGIEQEPGASGIIAVDHYRSVLPNRRVVPIPTTGSKLARATPLINTAEKGRVLMKVAHWNGVFLTEVDTFPIEGQGLHDDVVDAVAIAFNILHRRFAKTGTTDTREQWARAFGRTLPAPQPRRFNGRG